MLFNIIATLSIIYFIYRYRLHQHQAFLKLENKAQALEKEKTQVQYENLKQHLNPHFLFNSLTSLSSLIRTDQKLAINFLDGMSKIYRYILQSKDNETIALKEEIKFIDAFVQLQKTRFQNGLVFNIDIDEDFFHRKIVPVTLQNLIENAIKHNIVDEESPLVIDMYVEDEYLVVKNNLQKKKFVDTSNKQGLESLQSLYKYLSDKPFTCEEKDGYYVVKIPLI
jgi:LytS/YehU family sensor histidine kinase